MRSGGTGVVSESPMDGPWYGRADGAADARGYDAGHVRERLSAGTEKLRASVRRSSADGRAERGGGAGTIKSRKVLHLGRAYV